MILYFDVTANIGWFDNIPEFRRSGKENQFQSQPEHYCNQLNNLLDFGLKKLFYIFSFKKSKKYRLNGENLLTQRISLKLSPGCDSKWQYILLRNGLWWFGEDEYVKVGNWASVGSSQRSLNPSLEAQVMRNSCQWFKVHGLKWSRSQSLQSSLHPQKWPIQPRSQGPKAFRSGQWWILSSCSSLKVQIQRTRTFSHWCWWSHVGISSHDESQNSTNCLEPFLQLDLAQNLLLK